MIGLYGKIPSHGDFVRRNLPDTFLVPWDRWLQESIAHAQEALGDGFEQTWDEARAWRFRISPGLCGETGAQGVLLPSSDWVGRRFPLTVARLLREGEAPMPGSWYEALAAQVEAGVAQGQRVDEMASSLAPLDDAAAPDPADVPAEGWWQAPGEPPVASGLPVPDVFLSMVARSR